MRAWMVAVAIAVMALAALPAAAKVPLDYFAGTYEAVGRMPGADAMTFTEPMTITVEGDRLILDVGGFGAGYLQEHQGALEGAPPYAGRMGDFWIDCLFKNDPDNYPVMICKFWTQDRIGGEGLVTFWPDV
ncbi:MAG: hypothetical protein AAFV19_19015 [Pseudomonadota bacterium]